VISEYLPSSPPLAYRFPERNRIISGISNGLLVVEAGDRSGALITLDDAIEQGKEIFIIPSNINSRTAKGSNERLRAMPSALTIEVADVLDRFGKRAKEKKEADCIQLDFTEEKIIALLETDERHFDELLDETGLSPSELSSLLSRMEVLGLVKDLGGNYYGL
jgi:DNA processing protein